MICASAGQKGNRMNNKKPIAYAVDVETGRITWWIYERRNNG
jgi:hypothetical protein